MNQSKFSNISQQNQFYFAKCQNQSSNAFQKFIADSFQQFQITGIAISVSNNSENNSQKKFDSCFNNSNKSQSARFDQMNNNNWQQTIKTHHDFNAKQEKKQNNFNNKNNDKIFENDIYDVIWKKNFRKILILLLMIQIMFQFLLKSYMIFSMMFKQLEMIVFIKFHLNLKKF